MAADVAEMLHTYDAKISALLPQRNWFFPRESGEICQQDWLRRNFKALCDLAGICPARGSVTLYCLRHSFATHRLYKWLAKGNGGKYRYFLTSLATVLGCLSMVLAIAAKDRPSFNPFSILILCVVESFLVIHFGITHNFVLLFYWEESTN